MPININNNTNITAVDFNGQSISTVIHVNPITKRETVVFGATLAAPILYNINSRTYNSLSFLFKNMDTQARDIVITASAPGYPTRTRIFESIPALTNSMCTIGGTSDTYLESGVMYSIVAYAKSGIEQSPSSNILYGMETIPTPTKTGTPTITVIKNKSYIFSWKVNNVNENGLVDIETWIEYNGVRLNNIGGIENNIAYNASTQEFSTSTLTSGNSYVIYAVAKNKDGKQLSSLEGTNGKLVVEINQPDLAATPLVSHLYPNNSSIYSILITAINNEPNTSDGFPLYLQAKLYRNNAGSNELIETQNSDVLVSPRTPYNFTFNTLNPGYEYYYTIQAIPTQYKLNSNLASSTFYTKCRVFWTWYRYPTTLVTGQTDTVDFGSYVNVGFYTGDTPDKPGYSFSTWNKIDLYDSPGLQILGNTYIEANFTVNQYYVNWTDGYSGSVRDGNYDYGTVIQAYLAAEPTNILRYPANPTRELHYFSKWSILPPFTVPDSSTVISAEWRPYNYVRWWNGYSRYDIAGSPKLYMRETQVAKDTTITAVYYPPDPTRDGYRFNGWVPNFGTVSMQDNDIEIVANWVNQYNVYWYDGYSQDYIKSGIYDNGYVLQASDYPSNAAIEASLNTHERYFVSWNKLPNTAASTVNGADLYITATSNIYPTVYWEYDTIGTYTVDFKKIKPGTKLTIEYYPTEELLRTGYRFDGWDPIAGTFTTTTSDKYIYAQWVQQVSIYWRNINNTADIGTNPQVEDINYSITTANRRLGTNITGYTWAGWSTSVGGPAITYPYTVSVNRYLYAIYTPNTYTQTWRGFNNEIVQQYTTTRYGDIIGTSNSLEIFKYPQDPYKTGYTFNGWSKTAPYEVQGVNNITSSFTINSYTVTWKTEDQVQIGTPKVYTYNTAIPSGDYPTAPAIGCKTHTGWTTVAGTPVTQNLIIYPTYSSNSANELTSYSAAEGIGDDKNRIVFYFTFGSCSTHLYIRYKASTSSVWSYANGGNKITNSPFTILNLAKATYNIEIRWCNALDVCSVWTAKNNVAVTNSLVATKPSLGSYSTTSSSITWKIKNEYTSWAYIESNIGSTATWPYSQELVASGTETNPSFTKSGLSSNTAYKIYARAIVGGIVENSDILEATVTTAKAIYSVNWLDSTNGIILKTESITEGTVISSKPADVNPTIPQYQYLSGWSPSLPKTITGATTFESQYLYYTNTVTWDANHSGIILKTATYNRGTQILSTHYPSSPSRDGWTFSGWDTSANFTLTEDRTIKANWSPVTYTVQWKNFSGVVIHTKTYNYNTTCPSTDYPGAPPAPNCTVWNGWDTSSGFKVTSNVEISPNSPNKATPGSCGTLSVNVDNIPGVAILTWSEAASCATGYWISYANGNTTSSSATWYGAKEVSRSGGQFAFANGGSYTFRVRATNGGTLSPTFSYRYATVKSST